MRRAWRLRQAPTTALYTSPTTRIKYFGWASLPNTTRKAPQKGRTFQVAAGAADQICQKQGGCGVSQRERRRTEGAGIQSPFLLFRRRRRSRVARRSCKFRIYGSLPEYGRLSREWDSVEVTLVNANGEAVDGASDRYNRNESAVSRSLSPAPPEPTEAPTPRADRDARTCADRDARACADRSAHACADRSAHGGADRSAHGVADRSAHAYGGADTHSDACTHAHARGARALCGRADLYGRGAGTAGRTCARRSKRRQTAETAAGEGDPAAQPSAIARRGYRSAVRRRRAAEVAEVPSEDAETTAQAAEAPSENAEAAADAGEAPSENEDVAANNGGSPSDASAEAQSIEAGRV